MADRSTAEALGTVFWLLARQHEEASKGPFQESMDTLTSVAERIYDHFDGGYDFTPDQMEADDALVTLGLAAYRPAKEFCDPSDIDEYDDDDEILCYRGEDTDA